MAVDPWAKKGEVVIVGQLPGWYRVLRRYSCGPAGLVYDLQPLEAVGRQSITRAIQAWRCSRVPRPPASPSRTSSVRVETRTIEDVALAVLARHPEPAQAAPLAPQAHQNGHRSGIAGSDSGPTR